MKKEESPDKEDSKDQKRNRRYFNLFHNKESRYLKDLLTDEE